MRIFPPLLRLCCLSLGILIALTACGSRQRETPAAVLPQATPTPESLQGLFPTPTADLFQFLLLTPTSTLAFMAPSATPTSTTAALILPKTGADRSAGTTWPDWPLSAGLVAAGILLVVLGLRRARR